MGFRCETGEGAAVVEALIVRQPGDIALTSREAPTRAQGDVLIRPIVVGVCGTDLDIIDGRMDPAYVSYPIVIGHEWSGVVVEPGGSADLKAGDRVVVAECGRFGLLMIEIAERCGATVVPVHAEWGRLVEPEAVAKARKRIGCWQSVSSRLEQRLLCASVAANFGTTEGKDKADGRRIE